LHKLCDTVSLLSTSHSCFIKILAEINTFSGVDFGFD